MKLNELLQIINDEQEFCILTNNPINQGDIYKCSCKNETPFKYINSEVEDIFVDDELCIKIKFRDWEY